MPEKPLRKMMVSYALIIFFSVLLIILAGIATFKQGWEFILQQQQSSLEQRGELIDNQIMEIRQDFHNLITQYPTLNLSCTLSQKGSAYFNVYQVIQHLKKYNVSENLYIAYQSQDLILSKSASYGLENFYKLHFNTGEFSLEEFKTSIFEKSPISPWYFIADSTEGGPAWIVLRQVLDYQFNTPNAVAFYMLNTEELLKTIGSFSSPQQGNTLLRDRDMQLLAAQFPLDEKAEDSLVHSCGSTVGDWVYQVIQPKSILMHTIWLSMELIVGIIAVGLVIFLCGASYLSRRNSKMVRNIVDKNQDMQQLLENQIPYVRHDFYKNLLDGRFDSKEQLLMGAKLADINTQNQYHAVLLVDWKSAKLPDSDHKEEIYNLQLELLEIKKQLEDFSALQYSYDISYNRFAAICSSQDSATLVKQIEQIAEKVLAFAQTKGKQADIGVGTVKNDMLEISVSYSQAQCALMNLSVYSKRSLKYYQDLVLGSNGYNFSEQTKNLLWGAVCSGDEEETKHILSGIIHSNLEEQGLSEEGLRLFLLEFYSLILRIRNTISIQDEELLKSINSFSANYYQSNDSVRIHDIRALLERIAAYIGQSKKVYKDNLIYQIRDYLDANYRDPNMSLQLLAEKFEITETYLSHLFKKILNINFFQYLEDLRLQEACRLLKDTQLSVMAIVTQTGYASVNTFGRAFKRRYQVSATEFRNEG